MLVRVEMVIWREQHSICFDAVYCSSSNLFLECCSVMSTIKRRLLRYIFIKKLMEQRAKPLEAGSSMMLISVSLCQQLATTAGLCTLSHILYVAVCLWALIIFCPVVITTALAERD